MIQSVKRCLKKIIGSARLTYNELTTALTEVEGILSLSPLSYVSIEDIEEPLIKPLYLLTDYCIVSLPDLTTCNDSDPNHDDVTR